MLLQNLSGLLLFDLRPLDLDLLLLDFDRDLLPLDLDLDLLLLVFELRPLDLDLDLRDLPLDLDRDLLLDLSLECDLDLRDFFGDLDLLMDIHHDRNNNVIHTCNVKKKKKLEPLCLFERHENNSNWTIVKKKYFL